MTIKQMQCLLEYLGYSPGAIDGADGPKTQAALARFREDYGLGSEGLVGAVAGTVAKRSQGGTVTATVSSSDADQYLQADGKYHIPRGVNVQLTRNFSAREIHCQGAGCCSESIISKRVMELAQAVRDDLGVPVQIATAGGSGYRCPTHNAAVGGAAGSLHKIGEAVDLHANVPTSELKAAVLRHLTDGEVGTYSWGIHAGCWDRGYISQFNG